MDPLEILLFVSVTALGLILGSFGNVAIHRIPREIPLGLTSHRQSRCPKCEAPIRPWHNIPLVSYFLLRGRCVDCREPIASRYPWVEAISAALFAAAAWVFIQNRGFSWGYEALVGELVFLGVQLYFLWSLLVVTYIDIDFRIIPDRFSLGNWGLAVAACLIFREPEIWQGLAGGLLGFGMFYLLAWGYEKFKGIEGLGFGDVKMMGWLGTWLGFEWVPFMVLAASMTGLVVGLIHMRKSGEGFESALPFGPFLALAALLAWFLKFTSFSVGTLVF